MGLVKNIISNQKTKRFKEIEAMLKDYSMINVVGSDYHRQEVASFISERTIPLDRWSPIPCKLEHEPKNEHDPNAMKVLARDAAGAWQHIGYLPAEDAVNVRSMINSGACYYLLVKPDAKGTCGIAIKVKLYI
jgi:HIRAN domain.